ncbi:MAG: trypsin-like peptidase domain-containing protein [Myxococcales bacterium]|nr:trypsin-like peptidase domain-containing protein [Myxococcales bacterium]
MPEARRRHTSRAAAAGALAALLLLACAAAARAPFEKLEARIIEVAERVKPSVVHIEAIVRFNDQRNQVTGSGVIVSADGRILTNEHVVEKAEKVTVSVPGQKRKYLARIVGTDRQTDVALLRIAPDAPLPAARVGSTDDLRVGQWVLAIGNPYGLDGTVSFGIVSAKGRNLEVPDLLNAFIQTDAMIDHGSSGGPLVDLEGRVVGINSRGQGRGIGFTIPIETALDVMAQLEQGGIERGFLGVTLQPLDRELADYFGVPDVTGVLVNSVTEDSPAARAGLRTGDIITSFDGKVVEAEKAEDLGNFQRRVAALVPGAEASLEIVRGGERTEARVAIGTQPKIDPAEAASEALGVHVREITANLARNHRLASTQGAFVSFVARGSPAREAGLRMGDVIVAIEGADVTSIEDFRREIARAEPLERFLVTARRGEETKFVLVKPGARAAEEDEIDEAGEADLSEGH